jgi:hypothetical protein
MPERKDLPGEVTRIARDAVHVAIGLGVLGLNRAQVRRQELSRHLAEPKDLTSERLAGARERASKQMQAADEAVEGLIVRVEASLEPIEDRLPSPVRETVKMLHARSREARGLLRSIVRGTAA